MDIGKNMHGHPAPRPPKEQIFSPFTLHWSWLKQKILLASSKQQLWFKAICSKHVICYTYQLKECLITRWNVTTFSSVFIHRCSIWKCPKHALQPRPKKGSVEVTDTRVGQLVRSWKFKFLSTAQDHLKMKPARLTSECLTILKILKLHHRSWHLHRQSKINNYMKV